MNTSTCSTSRRRFLQLGSAAFASFPQILIAREDTTTVGGGDYRFECQNNWAKLPEGHSFGGATHGTAIDSQGFVYISHQGKPASISVFDPNGTFVRNLMPQHAGSGHGIDIRKEADGVEYLYLSPMSPKMAFTKTTLDGKVIWERGHEALRKASGLELKHFRPTNVSFAPNDEVLLGDGYGSHHIFHCDKDGNLIRTMGGYGNQDGKFRTPHGQWLDDRDGTPKTAVRDRANKRLQWFDMEGNHLKTMDGFLFPADIDIQGDLMLVPDLHARITILDGSNQVVAQLGDDPAWRARVLDKKEAMRGPRPDRWPNNRFVHPHDAVFDKDGNIIVAEWVVGGRITKLRKVD